MRRLDALHLEYPFAGSRMLVGLLRQDGHRVGHRHVATLMKRMGIVALYRRPTTSHPTPGHQIYPYLLRQLLITRPNHVWAMDITSDPMAQGFVYLVVVLDWFSRKALAWRLSITLETGPCVEALRDALARHGPPEIMNTDQGSQFTSGSFLTALQEAQIAISMDGKGAWRDNVVVERLWRTIKYEEDRGFVMVHITKAIKETIEKSTLQELKDFVKIVDRSAAWYLVSDYCFDDENKVNDTVTFSLILNHDRIENIKRYINTFQPKEIKKSSEVKEGFLKYIISPVVYNFSFVLKKDERYFANSLRSEIIENSIEHLEDDIETWIRDNPSTAEYFKDFKKRIVFFKEGKKSRSFNWKLMRKILIISCLASVIFYEITKINKPVAIAWISDRDGIVEKFDGISLDLAFANYLYLFDGSDSETSSVDLSIVPKIYFLTSKKGTIDDYEELVRIPDFLAGTIAELNGKDSNFRHEKYYPIFYETIVNAKNHSIIAIDDKENDFYTRRMKYVL